MDDAVDVAGDGGDHRHLPLVEQRVHDLGPHVDDLADQADVDLLAVDHGGPPLGGEQLRVLAGQADREGAVAVDEGDDVGVHLADEHHPHHLDGLRRRDAQSPAELALQAQPVQVRADLRPAAVHDDDPDAGVPQEHDVLGEGLLQLRARHRVAAVLDDDGAAGERLEPRQRLDERGRLGQGDVAPGRGSR